MLNRKALLTAGAVLGFIVASATSNAAWDRFDHMTRLTFGGDVALPGVTLSAGTYVFSLVNPETTPNLVSVRSTDLSHVYYLGITQPAARPTNLSSARVVTLGEAPRGTPPPVRAWFPRDSAMGHEFVYAR